MRGRVLLVLTAVALAASTPFNAASADATTEAQLRAALQQSTAQIASLEDQVANLQASQAPDVALIEALRSQVQALTKNGGGGGPVSPAETAKNNAALSALTRRLAAQNAALGRSQSAYAEQASAATASRSQNATLGALLTALHSQLNTCDTANMQLYKTGNQILDAYSHRDDVFGAIADREPFIGFKRVQLQNLVQADQDKLDANQLAPAAP